MCVINPGFIIGPSLDENNSGVSNGFMADMENGKFKMGARRYHGNSECS